VEIDFDQPFKII